MPTDAPETVRRWSGRYPENVPTDRHAPGSGHGHDEVVELLLRHGMQVDVADFDGNTR